MGDSKIVYFHAFDYSKDNTRFIDFAADRMRVVDTDIQNWAEKRGYPEYFFESFPGIMVDLLRLDAVSNGLKQSYMDYFSKRNCFTPPWDGKMTPNEVQAKFKTDLIDINEAGDRSMAEAEAITNSILGLIDLHRKQPSDPLSVIMRFFGIEPPIHEDPFLNFLKDEAEMALNNEIRQIQFFKDAAETTVQKTMNGPGGTGVQLFVDDDIAKVKLVEKEIMNATTKGKTINEIQTIKAKQELIKHGYDQHIVYDDSLCRSMSLSCQLYEGESIIAVDGKSTSNMSAEEILSYLRGACDTTVRVTVQKYGVTVERDVERIVPNVPSYLFRGESQWPPSYYRGEAGSVK